MLVALAAIWNPGASRRGVLRTRLGMRALARGLACLACVALGAREVVPGVSGAVVWMRRVRQEVQRSGVDAGLRMWIFRDGLF